MSNKIGQLVAVAASLTLALPASTAEKTRICLVLPKANTSLFNLASRSRSPLRRPLPRPRKTAKTWCRR